ncbi:MAG: TonB-dependent receptor [Pseudomonadota bacterium]
MRARHATMTRALLMSGAAATAMASLPAAAQDQTDAAAASTEEIFVTGSLIARDPNVGAPVPVQSVSGESLRLSGTGDIVSELREIPALSASVSGLGSVDSVFASDATAGVGESFLNLRGLGVARTLVLVDGRRHVSGLADEQAVDIESIPQGLIERVEVLTAGSSAIYGADAVSGVVNFILKDDYEGLELDVQAGISDQGDGEDYRINALYGTNFADGRANFTINAYYQRQTDLRFGDRSFSRNNGVADDLPNPALRFQQGEITQALTPNFARAYNTTQPFVDDGDGNLLTSFSYGVIIPSQADFISRYQEVFGETPTLTADELALLDRAADAPLRSIQTQPTFAISSQRGVIVPGDFGVGGDINGNGTADCLESYVGVNSTFANAFESPFGAIGGCYVVNDDGSIRTFQDGQVSTLVNQFGGDGIPNNFDEDVLYPDRTEYGAQINFSYDFTDKVTGFIEAKYSYNKTQFGSILNTFYDLLFVAADNPFVPAELQDIANAGASPGFLGVDGRAGLFVTRDPVDIAPRLQENERETYRIVGGIEGEFDNGWTYELSGNYGRTENIASEFNQVIMDRYFAAIDAVTDPETGEAVCRSDLDPNAISPTTPFDIPLFDFGYFTFSPGDGQCAPLDLLSGPNSASAAAVDFVLADSTDKFELEQLVFRALLTGDSADFFELPAGPIGFAVGAEYRREEATSTFNGLGQGILPVDGFIPGGGGEGGDVVIPAGTLIADVDEVRQSSLVFDPEQFIRNSGGDYDVWDVFAEVLIPLIVDAPFAEELSVGGAVRYSDYSTIGSTTTWQMNGTWAPIESLRFRASYSSSVRAPNIFELFAPDQGTTFRPDEPCLQAEIDALIEAGDPRGANRAANCAADPRIPGGSFSADPLTARFSGVTSGNPDLFEETAKTYVIGAVLQPTWFEGFNLSVDYYNIEIEDAIDAPDDQDIVDACYDVSPDAFNLNEGFCSLFTRRDDGGLNFLRQQERQFGRITTSGVDIAATYNFAVGDLDFSINTNWTHVFELDEFFDPADPEAVDPELGEIQRPRWAGNVALTGRYDALQVTYELNYLGEQGLRAVEIEDLDINYGPSGLSDRVFIHDINASYQVNDMFTVYGGINNLADRQPFITEQAYPVSPLGRQFFLGVTANVF